MNVRAHGQLKLCTNRLQSNTPATVQNGNNSQGEKERKKKKKEKEKLKLMKITLKGKVFLISFFTSQAHTCACVKTKTHVYTKTHTDKVS